MVLRKKIARYARSNTPRWLVLLIDIYLIGISYFLAYFVRFGFSLDLDYSSISKEFPLILLAYLTSFLAFSSYKNIIRHTEVKDAITLFYACGVAFAILGIFSVSTYGAAQSSFENLSISILAIHFIIALNILVISRFVYKSLFGLMVRSSKRTKRTLIYGTGESGLLTFKLFSNLNHSENVVVGFVDNHNIRNRKINGLNVYSESELGQSLIDRLHVDVVVLAMNSMPSTRLMEISKHLNQFGIQVEIVPHPKKWIDGRFESNQIKPVQIEDLLGREPINLCNPKLAEEFKGKTILVTGAAGSIGSEIAKQLSHFDYKQIIILDQAESDIYNLQQFFKRAKKENIEAIVSDVRNKETLNHIFSTFTPDIVFHAAAYKHVPFMEESPYEAIRVNVQGTRNVALLASKYKCQKFVLVSTDKAVNPTNIMGASKRLAELQVSLIAKKSDTKFITTRFGNVLGSNGSVIPLFRDQIASGGPLTLTHKDITRYFMTIPEACQLVLEAGIMGNGGEVFVFDMGKSVKIFDLAVNMIRLSGLRYPEDVDIEITGLRPGEKLYEELLSTKENTIPTYNKKILIAKVNMPDATELRMLLKDLDYNLKPNNNTNIVRLIKKMVPEFKSNNSIYESLDQKTKVIHLTAN